MQAHSHQYTIRGVPAELHAQLVRRAKLSKLSLNQLIVNELSRSLLGEPQRADFSDVTGGWAGDKAFDAALTDQRRIDPKLWK
ncbi:MAG: toxin-antitoxin system HicB family antitoxin [Acidobacteriota bacterium]